MACQAIRFVICSTILIYSLLSWFLMLSRVLQVLVTTIGLCFASWLLYLIIKPQIWLNSAGHKWNAAANGTQIYYHYVLQNIPKLKKVTASVRKSNGVVLEYNFLQDVRSCTWMSPWRSYMTSLLLLLILWEYQEWLKAAITHTQYIYNIAIPKA